MGWLTIEWHGGPGHAMNGEDGSAADGRDDHGLHVDNG